ncbi:MAG: helix-turn-helix transcriptional regulator [Bifidobacterium sp.]|nr:helix-turn-helix transcriptional regulator [Bifidobacterium sp.]
MAFNDNLQALRARRNMTQEQLAMLVGVSRQAISKWESAKAYPEMDKLLILCDLFDVTLDDLVLSDATAPGNTAGGDATDSTFPKANEPPAIPDGPARDVTGYDAHTRRFADHVAWGAAAIILGVAGANAFDASGSILGADNPYNDVCTFLCVMLGVIVGCALLIPAGLAHSAFCKRHPYVQDFYTEADRAAGRRGLAACVTVGLMLVMVGCALSVLADEVWHIPDGWPYTLMLACFAMGVWCFVRGGMDWARLDIDAYNRKAEYKEKEDASQWTPTRYDKVNGAICGIIMILATIVGLSLLFLFIDGEAHRFFWLSWPIGGLLCAISSLVTSAVKATKE